MTASVLTTVNAPYGTSLGSADIVLCITQARDTDEIDVAVFAFLSDVDARLQLGFLREADIPLEGVLEVAYRYSRLAGYRLPLDVLFPERVDCDAGNGDDEQLTGKTEPLANPPGR